MRIKDNQTKYLHMIIPIPKPKPKSPEVIQKSKLLSQKRKYKEIPSLTHQMLSKLSPIRKASILTIYITKEMGKTRKYCSKQLLTRIQLEK